MAAIERVAYFHSRIAGIDVQHSAIDGDSWCAKVEIDPFVEQARQFTRADFQVILLPRMVECLEVVVLSAPLWAHIPASFGKSKQLGKYE